MNVSPYVVALGALLILGGIVLILWRKHKLPFLEKKEGYLRSGPGQNSAKQLSPVDWYSSPSQYPHREADPTSYYQPLHADPNTPNPIDLSDNLDRLNNGTLFQELRNDYQGFGPVTNYGTHVKSLNDNIALGDTHIADALRSLPHQHPDNHKYAPMDRAGHENHYGRGFRSSWNMAEVQN